MSKEEDNDGVGQVKGIFHEEADNSKLGAEVFSGDDMRVQDAILPGHADDIRYCADRLVEVNRLKQKNIDPYPHRFNGNLMKLSDVLERYHNIEEDDKKNVVNIAGRVHRKEIKDGPAIWYDINRNGISLLIKAEEGDHVPEHHDNRNFMDFHASIKVGDIVGIKGCPAGSDGTLFLLASKVKLLAPCLHILPQPHHLMPDAERYSKRYLDLILHQNVEKKFRIRAKAISCLRKFLNDRDFLEVETPMLHTIPGTGALAIPFTTSYNPLEMNLFLRVAPELHLKMLIVGGMDRVYEIGRNFREDVMDESHNLEYTACEFYMAYADNKDLMRMTEDLISEMAREITGSYTVEIVRDGQQVDIDCRPANGFTRLQMLPTLEERTGKQFPAASELGTGEALERLRRICDDLDVERDERTTAAQMLKKLVKKFLKDECIQPTFIVDYPEILSPLAKHHRDAREGITERFELFINKKKICNAYTELNDSEVQRERFRQQAEERARGNEEAHEYDENFCTALEYGLPPTAGWGMGIDTMVMFLTNSSDIKEVLLFPTVPPNVEAPDND